MSQFTSNLAKKLSKINNPKDINFVLHVRFRNAMDFTF